jgi:Polyketide cyclase / dehydrase and lipid transport
MAALIDKNSVFNKRKYTFLRLIIKNNCMKILKNLFIALVVIVAVGGIVLYFLPNHYSVSNSIEINKPADVVYAQLSDYNKWSAWSPWREADPEAKITINGTPGTPGHKMSWDGKKSGMGTITIISAGTNQFVYSQLDFIKPFQATAKDMMKLESADGKTKVTWTNTGGLPFPLGRLMGLSIDKMLGGDQRKGLQKLKTFAESMPEPAAAVSDTTAKMM